MDDFVFTTGLCLSIIFKIYVGEIQTSWGVVAFKNIPTYMKKNIFIFRIVF